MKQEIHHVTTFFTSSSLLCKSSFLVPEDYHFTVLPWRYLLLAILGFLTNRLAALDHWRTKKTPTVIFTLDIVVSDLMLCCSFPFRIWLPPIYIVPGGRLALWSAQFFMVSCFYINMSFFAVDQHQQLCYRSMATLQAVPSLQVSTSLLAPLPWHLDSGNHLCHWLYGT